MLIVSHLRKDFVEKRSKLRTSTRRGSQPRLQGRHGGRRRHTGRGERIHGEDQGWQTPIWHDSRTIGSQRPFLPPPIRP